MTAIGIDGHVLAGRHQGSRTVLARLLSEITTLDGGGCVTLFLEDDGPPQLAPLRRHRLKSRSGFVRLLFEIPREVLRRKIDIVLWQYISSPFCRSRNAIFVHDVLPLTHPTLFPFGFRMRCRMLYTLSIALSDRIVTCSDYSRAQIARLFPFARERISVVKNGPSFEDEQYFAAREAATDRPFILAVGRVERRKNMRLLAEAFLDAGLPDVDLVIVGERDLGYSEPLPEHPRIRVLKRISDPELIGLYRQASLFVYPSAAEGFGLPLLDALLFGVPTIASNQTSLPEVGGDLATYFDPTAVDARVRLARLIRHHFGAHPVPAASPDQRRRHLQQFNWRRSAATLLDVLGEAA